MAACASAHAQFGSFNLPGFGRGGGGGGGLDLGNIISNAGKAVREVDEAEEVRIGREFAATLLGAKPAVADARVQRYLNTLGRWIALHSERPDLPWTFAVLDDPGFNAFATPGGHVFITRGLFERMRNEAELAGVLAHEIAHVVQKHHLKAVQKNARFALAGDVLTAKGGRSELANEARAALLDIGRKLYASGLDQGDEFEADRMGVVLAARAGFDAYGLPSVLQLLQRQSGRDGQFALLFKTHPAPSARIEMLEAVMQERFEKQGGALGQLPSARLAEFRK